MLLLKKQFVYKKKVTKDAKYTCLRHHFQSLGRTESFPWVLVDSLIFSLKLQSEPLSHGHFVKEHLGLHNSEFSFSFREEDN